MTSMFRRTALALMALVVGASGCTNAQLESWLYPSMTDVKKFAKIEHEERDAIHKNLSMQHERMHPEAAEDIGKLRSDFEREFARLLEKITAVQGTIPDNIREDVELIYNQAQRAADVTKNLLAFARRHPPVKKSNQMNRIIEDVLKLRAYEQNVNGIKVRKQLAPDLPEIGVDYFQMQQVLLNLIINAEYFMMQAHNRGTLTISTSKQNGTVKISIADDGPGIPSENLRRIFDPFFTTKDIGKGTGLGLSICHTIVTEHGGQIYASSRSRKGATIVVELPANGNNHVEDVP